MHRIKKLRYGTSGAVRAIHMSGASVRKTFLDYFTERGHVAVRSSSVVPLCDPTVPFVNAGMNQFKGIFLGRHRAPHPCVVNSQKCIRVGGKHNDLDVVGADGTHHTMFEMLGNWSFGDYYKAEACKLAWELLTGPYRLRPEQLTVTYFAGDANLGLNEDLETRDIWRTIGVRKDFIKPMGVADNFWEMGLTGPCGPCTEIHHIGGDGELTEIWNLVFIQYNRERDGSIRELPSRHVDTGMGLERAAALLQGKRSNYDTDLFQPIIKCIEKESKFPAYSGKFGSGCELDTAYRCLADHARMISVCLADGMLPSVSLNVKQMMRKSFKLSEEVFQVKYGLMATLYDRVAEILGPTYPELHDKMADAKTIITHEEEAYAKLRSNLAKKWKDLSKMHPEVESLNDVEISGFVEGYKQFKQAMSSVKTQVIPGEIVFKLYDTHGFNEDVIDRIAKLNKYSIDKEGFLQLLNKHRGRHKTSFKEQTDNDKSTLFNKIIEKLNKNGIKETNDDHKYKCDIKNNKVTFPDLITNIVAITNSEGEELQSIQANKNENIYIVTKDTNFYCEEGGQAEDKGKIIINENKLDVINVFKIRNIVFHKVAMNEGVIKVNDEVKLSLDIERRLNSMKNHTATHVLNAALRIVLPKSVICQVGSKVTDSELVFSLAIYGEKLSQEVILKAEDLVRHTISSDATVDTRLTDSVELSRLDDVLTVPGEVYPDTAIRLVQFETPNITSRELCCGTHVPSTGHIEEFCITSVKGAGGHAPVIRAITGDRAKEVIQICETARRLRDDASPRDARQLEAEVEVLRARVHAACGGAGPALGRRALCLRILDELHTRVGEIDKISLDDLGLTEMREQMSAPPSSRPFVVHFLVCSYLTESASLVPALGCCDRPAMVFGCANGVIKVAARVPQNFLSSEFSADKWINCVLPTFNSKLIKPSKNENIELLAAMSGTKVSLITCEGLVRDAMKAATEFAEAHVKFIDAPGREDDSDEERDRRHS